MKRFKIFFLTFCFIFLSFFLKDTYANAINVSLDPSSGQITSTGTKINIIINSNGQEYMGMNTRLSYSGPIEYLGVDKGNIKGCAIEEGVKKENEIVMFCLMFSDIYTDNGGIFATLNFKSTGEGSAKINIEAVDAALESTQSGGNYSAVLAAGSTQPIPPTSTTTTNTPTSTTTTNTSTSTTTTNTPNQRTTGGSPDGSLPDSSLSDSTYILIGISFLIVSMFFFSKKKKLSLKMQQKVFN